MNNQSPPVSLLGSLDLQTLLASVPKQDMNLTNIELKQEVSSAQSMPNLNFVLTQEQLNQLLLQQLQNQAAAATAAAIVSTMASTSADATSGIMTNTCTAPANGNPMMFHQFNPFALSSLPFGLPALPPHSSLGFLPTMNQLRSSVSALTSPVPSSSQIVPDVRPRAFSSAATLQTSKHESGLEKRRKRSGRSETIGRPILSRPLKSGNSVLRHLVESEDEPTKPIPMPTTQDEAKLRMDMVRVSVLNGLDHQNQQGKAKSPESNSNPGIRRIIDDQDLPDSVGPDSPFRHHPKYQKRIRDEESDMADAITAYCVVSGMWQSDPDAKDLDKASNDSGYVSADSPKKSFSDILENAIVRELVTAE